RRDRQPGGHRPAGHPAATAAGAAAGDLGRCRVRDQGAVRRGGVVGAVPAGDRAAAPRGEGLGASAEAVGGGAGVRVAAALPAAQPGLRGGDGVERGDDPREYDLPDAAPPRTRSQPVSVSLCPCVRATFSYRLLGSLSQVTILPLPGNGEAFLASAPG